MSISLDIGTQYLRSLRRESGRLVGRKNHATYLSLDDTPSQRRMLEKASIRYATCDDSLLIIGQAAIETAAMLQEPCVPLLVNRQIPENDPVARQVLTSLVDCLLPIPMKSGEICWTNIPGSNDEETAVKRFFTQIIRLRGYEPRFISAGLAVILAELGRAEFSGIGCDFGGGDTHLTYAHHANEIATVSIQKGGEWIDSQLAESEKCYLWDSVGNRYLNTSAITHWKESSLISVQNPITEREQRLSLLCEELIGEAMNALERELVANRTIATLRKPVPFICSGGLSRLNGFPELVLEVLRTHSLPVDISEVRRASDVDYTIARGCLILAELTSDHPLADVA